MNGQIPLPPFQNSQKFIPDVIPTKTLTLNEAREKYLKTSTLTPIALLDKESKVISKVETFNQYRRSLIKAALATLNAAFNQERDLVNTDTPGIPANNIVSFARKNPLVVYNQKGPHGFELEYNSDRNGVVPKI